MEESALGARDQLGGDADGEGAFSRSACEVLCGFFFLEKNWGLPKVVLI